jgi:hypothetical protein
VGDLTEQVTVGQRLSCRPVVVAGVQVHGDRFGQRLEVLDRVEGRGQQGVVDGVGRRGDRGERNAGAVMRGRWQPSG